MLYISTFPFVHHVLTDTRTEPVPETYMAAFKFNPFQSLRRLLLFRPDVVQNEDLLR